MTARRPCPLAAAAFATVLRTAAGRQVAACHIDASGRPGFFPAPPAGAVAGRLPWSTVSSTPRRKHAATLRLSPADGQAIADADPPSRLTAKARVGERRCR